MNDIQTKTYHCPVEVTLDMIGGRWKPLILWHLKEWKVLRHGALRRLIPGVTQKMLTQQLRQLEADGLVQRTMYAEVPPRVEYSLTAYGDELKQILELFCDWGEAHAKRAGFTLTKPPSLLDTDSPRRVASTSRSGSPSSLPAAVNRRRPTPVKTGGHDRRPAQVGR